MAGELPSSGGESLDKSYIRKENQALLDQLEQLDNDPHGMLIALQEAMHIDIASQRGLDFHGWKFVKDPESFRLEQLSPSQYEAIKSFEEVAKVFMQYSVLSPTQLGLWFMSPRDEFYNRGPIDHLFLTMEDGRFNRDSIGEVIHAAAPMLTPGYGGEEALWGLWHD